MSLLERGLAKLTINAWKDREGKIPAGKMSVMYNPENIQLDYQTRYRTEETINKASQSNRYVIAEPVGLNLELLFDSQMPGNSTPVETQIAMLKSLCAVDAATESPRFLRITWGKMRWENKGWFAGRASGLSVVYTLFDRDATPLRATARLSLVADESFVIQQTELNQKSPASALLGVPDMASLPQLALTASTTLADSTDYLSMAWNNDLDNLDDFQPGDYLQALKGGNMNDITLKIAGKVCSLGISRLRVAQQINAIPSAQLELQIPTDSKDTLAQSAVAAITPGVAVVIEMGNLPLFSGTLTQKRLLLRGKLWSVRLEARHSLQKLAFYPHSRVFRQQDDGAILNMLFQQAGIKMTRTATLSAIRHDQMVQFRVSDWQFILSRLFATNAWLLPDAASSSVTVSPIATPAAAARTLERYAEYSDYGLHELDLTFDNRFTPDSLSLRGWDIAGQKLSSAQKTSADTFHPWKAAGQEVTLSRQPDYQLAFSTMPETQLDTLSRSWINHQQLTGVQGRIVLEGTRDFRIGESIKLDKFGAGLDGTVILTGINQLFNTEEGWRSELLAGLPASFAEPVPSVQSLHIATVADFTADPEHLDRIPVSLPALNLPGEHIFARLGKPWASKASGFCFYPEPGDEVVVGFIESDPRYPVILDSLHNPKNSAPFPPDAQNLRKELVVSKGDYAAQLQINTEEKTVTLASGNNSLKLTADQNFQLSTPDTMEFTAKSISLQASEKLSASGQSQVEITSTSINLKQ